MDLASRRNPFIYKEKPASIMMTEAGIVKLIGTQVFRIDSDEISLRHEEGLPR